MRDEHDLAAQRRELSWLGVDAAHMYIDAGLSGVQRERSALSQALETAQSGDTLVVPSLARLAGSIRDARDIVSRLFDRGTRLSLGGSLYDPIYSSGKNFLHALFVFAEFEVNLMRLRTKEGMAGARARGKLRGRQPKLSIEQRLDLLRLHDTGDSTITDLAETFSVSRATVYRILKSRLDNPESTERNAIQAATQSSEPRGTASPTDQHAPLSAPDAELTAGGVSADTYQAQEVASEPPTNAIVLPWLQAPWSEALQALDEDWASGRISTDAHRKSVNLLIDIQRVRIADAGFPLWRADQTLDMANAQQSPIGDTRHIPQHEESNALLSLAVAAYARGDLTEADHFYLLAALRT